MTDPMHIDWDVPIEMDDGAVLRADVFRPDPDRSYPVILSYGPYAKGLAFQEGYPDQWRLMTTQHPDVEAGSSNRYQNWEVVDPEKWVPDGYVVVRVDSRGCGRSPGYVDVFSPRETDDLVACIEWAGTQVWSSGKVGLNGISYYAINQWHAAARQPEHLAAICIWEGAADFYRDMTHHGGILSTFWANWYDMQVKTVQYGLGDRGAVSQVTGVSVTGDTNLSDEALDRNRADLGADIRNHPLDGAFHRDRSPDWAKIDVPLLSAGNWGGQGLHLRGNVEGFVRSATEQKWLEIHGLEHWTHFYTDYGVGLQKRFFAHYLQGEDNGWDNEPPVRLQIRHLDRFQDRLADSWPLPDTKWTTLILDAGAMTLSPEAPAGDQVVEYDATGSGVTFLREPFDAETEITGPLALKLFVSSATEDADIFAVVRVFDPEGEEVTFQGAIDPHTPIAQGWLRASHRRLDPELSLPYRPYHTHHQAEPLTPGEVYELDVEIWPTSIVVPAGYRLGLTVRGNDYVFEGDLGDASLTTFKNRLTGCGPFLHDDPQDRPADIFGSPVRIHTGPGAPSRLLAPVIPQSSSQSRDAQFGARGDDI
ncbi:MAG TPA: CocE/NonD family hydrolase [Acidimicrobiia bacterium]|nr:CocE/NonD family hydrolase [Acidimicrobiia bacterium]